LTVCRELASQTDYRLFHNHLVVDLATSLFAHETDEYFALIRAVRRATYAAAASAGLNLLVTGVYRGTKAQDESMREMIEPVLAAGGQPLFVRLTCERDEWLRRLQSASRRDLHKITDPTIVLDLLERFDLFAALPFEPGLTVDTTSLSPDRAAAQ